MLVELANVSPWISRSYSPALSRAIILLNREIEKVLAPLHKVRDPIFLVLCCWAVVLSGVNGDWSGLALLLQRTWASFASHWLLDHPFPSNEPFLLLSTAGFIASCFHSVPFSKSEVQEKVLILCVLLPGAVQTILIARLVLMTHLWSAVLCER